MVEPAPEGRPAEGLAPENEDLYGVSPECVRATREALEAQDGPRIQDLVAPLHPADLADLIERLSDEERARFIAITHHRIEPETLSYLDEAVRAEVIEQLGPQRFAAALSELDTDDAIDLLQDLDEESKRRILDSIPAEDRVVLEEGLTYPEDSAGRLMQRELVAVPSFWTVGQTIDFLRASGDLPDDFYDLFIVDPAYRPIGSVPLSRAMRAKRAVKLIDLVQTEPRTVPVTMDQEAVAHLFRQYGLVSAPVVGPSGRLVGVITVDDVVRVIEEETEEDLMKLSGVAETDLYRAVIDTAKRRFSWLVVNLVTAVIASVAIGFFDATIDQIVALAVLMPIVASMGGNAGTQTLTVAVRALAVKDLNRDNAWRFIGKELIVGWVNGVLFALLAGLVAWLWFGSPELGVVIAAAMICNLVVAGLSGTLIPLGLDRLGIDPAIASSVFLTTITDVVGFVTFLGLATLFLL